MKTLFAAAVAAMALPAAAAQFDFYKLGRGAALDFLPTDGIACTGGDLCSSNVNGGVRNGDLSFSHDGISLKATAAFGDAIAAVVQDHESGWSATTGAGLGVYHKTGDNSDDNITTGERLTITFDQAVRLTRIDLRAEGHNYTGWGNGKTFLLDDVVTALPQGTGFINLDKTGKVFTFAFNGALGQTAPSTGDQFYLAALTVQAVPEPGTYALLGSGLGVLGFVARRRRKVA